MKDVRSVSLVDRRGYLTVVLELEGDIPGLVVRKPEGLRDWYNIVQKQVTSLTNVCTMMHFPNLWLQVKDAKARVMLSTEQFWAKKNSGQEVDTADTEWLVSRWGMSLWVMRPLPTPQEVSCGLSLLWPARECGQRGQEAAAIQAQAPQTV